MCLGGLSLFRGLILVLSTTSLEKLKKRRACGRRLGELVRGHWSIENQPHWCLDVSFGDDAARVCKDHGPANLAAIKRHALGLVKRSTPPPAPR